MDKKLNKNDGGLTGERPGPGTEAGGSAPGVGTTPAGQAVGEDVRDIADAAKNTKRRTKGVLSDDVGRALFELYVARVATIDRYRIPITDRGFPAALRRAFDEAVVALDVFEDAFKVRKFRR